MCQCKAVVTIEGSTILGINLPVVPSTYTLLIKDDFGNTVKELTERDLFPYSIAGLPDGLYSVCVADYEAKVTLCGKGCQCHTPKIVINTEVPPPPPALNNCCSLTLNWLFGKITATRIYIGAGVIDGVVGDYTVTALLFKGNDIIGSIANPTSSSYFAYPQDDGIYTVKITVKDSKGCTSEAYAPPILVSSCSILNPTVTFYPPIDGQWHTPLMEGDGDVIAENYVELQQLIGGTWQTVYATTSGAVMEYATHYTAGVYRYKITGITANGCTASAIGATYIIEPQQQIPSTDPCNPVPPTPVACQAECNIRVSIAVAARQENNRVYTPMLAIAGGTPQYIVIHQLINLGNGQVVAEQSVAATAQEAYFDMPIAGIFHIQTLVQDARGCLFTAQSQAFLPQTQPSCEGVYAWNFAVPSYEQWLVGNPDISPDTAIAELQQFFASGWQTIQTLVNPSPADVFPLQANGTYRIKITMLGAIPSIDTCADIRISPSFTNTPPPLPSTDPCDPIIPYEDTDDSCINCNDVVLQWVFGQQSGSTINVGNGAMTNPHGQPAYLIEVRNTSGQIAANDILPNQDLQLTDGVWIVKVVAIDEKGCATTVQSTPYFVGQACLEQGEFWKFAPYDAQAGAWNIGQPVADQYSTNYTIVLNKFLAGGWQTVVALQNPTPESILTFESHFNDDGFYELVAYDFSGQCAIVQHSGMIQVQNPNPKECPCLACSSFGVTWNFPTPASDSWLMPLNPNVQSGDSPYTHAFFLQQLIDGQWITVTPASAMAHAISLTEHPAGIYRILALSSDAKGCVSEQVSPIHIYTPATDPTETTPDTSGCCCLEMVWHNTPPKITQDGCGLRAIWDIGSVKSKFATGAVTYTAVLMHYINGAWSALGMFNIDVSNPSSFDLSELPQGLYAIEVIASDQSGCFDKQSTTYYWQGQPDCRLEAAYHFVKPQGAPPYASNLPLGFVDSVANPTGNINITLFVEKQNELGTWSIIDTIYNYIPQSELPYDASSVIAQGGNIRVTVVIADQCCQVVHSSPTYPYEKLCCCLSVIAQYPMCDLSVSTTFPTCQLLLNAAFPTCTLDIEPQPCVPSPCNNLAINLN